jgi:ribosome-binding protein aMBF1 (putative translation factor)
MNRIKEFRERQGLTQVDLSFKIRTASTNICAYENGRLIPGPKVKRVLAKVLKTTPEELFPIGDYLSDKEIILKLQQECQDLKKEIEMWKGI